MNSRAFRQLITQRRPAARQPGFHNIFADTEAFGGFGGVEAIDLPQHEDLAQAVRSSSMDDALSDGIIKQFPDRFTAS